MPEQLSNDFSFGTIMENLNNKIDIDFNNVKDKSATVAKILNMLGFEMSVKYGVPSYVLFPVRDENGNRLCMQWGGQVLGKANEFVPVKLAIEMANSEYEVFASNSGNVTTLYQVKVGGKESNTTTEVKLLSSNANTGVNWMIIGLAKG